MLNFNKPNQKPPIGLVVAMSQQLVQVTGLIITNPYGNSIFVMLCVLGKGQKNSQRSYIILM